MNPVFLGLQNSPQLLQISIPDQRLVLFEHTQAVLDFSISTALKGTGEQFGSECTPRGWHQVRAKIGDGLSDYAVLKGRRWTGQIWSPALSQAEPNRDWILSRILWLSGLQVGFNRLHHRDTFRRFIYLHGTPDNEPMGIPKSHGCIRLHVEDMLCLFKKVRPHCPAYISELKMNFSPTWFEEVN